jgi:hypothetical protein
MAFHILLPGKPPMPPPDADFAFTINFERGSGDPRRVFDAASLLIDAFEELDEAVAGAVDSKIQTVMVLEDVEASSLKVWLKNVLHRIDDGAIKDLEWKKAVGAALLKAKYLVLRWLDKEQTNAGTAIDIVREELRAIARETDVKHSPDYAPVHEGKLVASMDKIQEAKRALGPKDTLIIESDQDTYEVDLSKTWEPSDVVKVENLTETTSEGELILRIKKPDLLGSSVWQFSHGRATISAPIHDEKWLADFHYRKIALHSGDALRVLVKTIFNYDKKGVLVDQKIEILKVKEVIKGDGET